MEKNKRVIMRSVWVAADNIISPLGFTSEENFAAISKGESALLETHSKYIEFAVWTASFNEDQLSKIKEGCNNIVNTKFESFLYFSIKKTLAQGQFNPESDRTIFVFATTKGNIELIVNKQVEPVELNLFHSAQRITKLFGNPNKPIVVSNACISGGTAILVAKDLLEAGIYDYAVVCGADTLNEFVLSGFNSLKALSPNQCKPFDADRVGINLGEAAATVVLKAIDSNEKHSFQIKVAGGSITNDANHISGPSRTGLELAMAIQQGLKQANLTADQIDLVSAHGTATSYNDEMEAKALNHAGLNEVLTNSLKGYFGHTLGAAGLLECIITMHSMKHNLVIQSRGFDKLGTTVPVNICKQNTSKEIKNSVKTLAGFGGCNAALIFSKQ